MGARRRRKVRSRPPMIRGSGHRLQGEDATLQGLGSQGVVGQREGLLGQPLQIGGVFRSARSIFYRERSNTYALLASIKPKKVTTVVAYCTAMCKKRENFVSLKALSVSFFWFHRSSLLFCWKKESSRWRKSLLTALKLNQS
jgi:hypothetical protein